MMVRPSIRAQAEAAQRASLPLAACGAEQRTDVLRAMAVALLAHRDAVLAANEEDCRNATAAGLSDAMIDRLRLNADRLRGIADALTTLAQLPDPLGAILHETVREDGLRIQKLRVPIGVLAMIYESRPNVTADAIGIAVRTGNAILLRGGSEALQTNLAIFKVLESTATELGLPNGCLQYLAETDREAVRELVSLEGVIDLVIPRGGEGLIRAVAEHAKVPVLKHYKGLCHMYVDSEADLAMAVRLVDNAKCQRPGVCNALETLLVHQQVASTFLPMLEAALAPRGVAFRADEQSRAYLTTAEAATEDDWETEYLDLRLAVRVVPDLQSALSHIARYGSKHTDAIVSNSRNAQQAFVLGVDSGVVAVNASTRFNDGGEFGFGAEIGISTDKLHARGPVGPAELTTYKYIVSGDGHIRN